MKKLSFLIAFIFPVMLFAQSVAINNDASQPDITAILDIKSNTKGLLIPRLTTAERTAIASPAVGLTVFDSNTATYWIFRGDLNGSWVELMHSLDKHWDRTGTNVFNTNSGNVGIGTNNPTEKLTINATNPAIRFTNANVEKGYLENSGNNVRLGTYGTNSLGNLVFTIRGSDKMIIDPNGNFGIATSSPSGKFQIASGYEASLVSHGYLMLGFESSTNLVMDNNEIMARSNGAPSQLYLQNEGGNVTIGDPTYFNSSHKLGVEGNMVVTGGLRIGTTTSPGGYKLAVDGKAICTELIVRTVPNWPDYVFAGDHKLTSLDEVEEFIKKNNHLPGIPSAKTIEANGISVGEMQKMQMEKIEELTLYIIELKKEMALLKNRKN